MGVTIRLVRNDLEDSRAGLGVRDVQLRDFKLDVVGDGTMCGADLVYFDDGDWVKIFKNRRSPMVGVYSRDVFRESGLSGLRRFVAVVTEKGLDDIGMSGLTVEVDVIIEGKEYVQVDPGDFGGRLSEPYILDETGCLCSIDRLLGEKVIKELL